MMGSRWGWNQDQFLLDWLQKPPASITPKATSKLAKKDEGKPKAQLQINDNAQVMFFDKNEVTETIDAGF